MIQPFTRPLHLTAGTYRRRVDAATGIITTVAGSGTSGENWMYDNRLATESRVYGPTNIALDASGDLYWTEGTNNVVRRVANATGIISTVTFEFGHRTYCCDDGPASAAKVDLPNGILATPTGTIIFADSSNNIVRELYPGTVCSPPPAASPPPSASPPPPAKGGLEELYTLA
jgi:hypothetical protein